MKKFFVTMMLAVALVFIGSQAEAREVYVGTYSDGTDVYILTETIGSMDGERAGINYFCDVRAGRDYLHYSFEGNWYSNSEGYRGYINDGSSPVAAAIHRYIMNYYGH